VFGTFSFLIPLRPWTGDSNTVHHHHRHDSSSLKRRRLTELSVAVQPTGPHHAALCMASRAKICVTENCTLVIFINYVKKSTNFNL